jgi:hypothetical protein
VVNGRTSRGEIMAWRAQTSTIRGEARHELSSSLGFCIYAHAHIGTHHHSLGAIAFSPNNHQLPSTRVAIPRFSFRHEHHSGYVQARARIIHELELRKHSHNLTLPQLPRAFDLLNTRRH